MTKAVCLGCGEMKFGAFTRCPTCGLEPLTPMSRGQHVLVTDHYYSNEDLAQISARVKSGEALSFDPEALAEATRAAADLAPSPGERPWLWPLVVIMLLLIGAAIFVSLWK